jgi:hypothetical protein
MMGWLIALGVLTALAVLPLGASVIYDENGPLVRVIAGPLKLKVYPKKKKTGDAEKQAEKKRKKQQKEQAKKEKKAAQTPLKTSSEPSEKPEKKEKGGSILDFWPFVELGVNLLGDLRRKLRVNRLKLHMTMAADDPCDLAVNYGKANASMAALLAQLERLFVIKRRDVRINCDFTADKATILARLDLTITLGRILSLAVRYGFRALRTYLSIQKKRKGGANL